MLLLKHLVGVWGGLSGFTSSNGDKKREISQEGEKG